MGKKRCITEAQVQAAFNLAMSNGKHEFCDNYDNPIVYSVDACGFAIDKPNSHSYLEIGTFGELFYKSITADKCKLCYFDKSTGKTVYSEWWETILVNNKNHPLYGALARRNDGYIIADNTVIFEK